MAYHRFNKLLEETGRLMDIPGLCCDEEGFCAVVPGDDIQFNMQPIHESSNLLIYTEIATPEPECLDHLGPILLVWNMDEERLGHGSLGLLGETVILFFNMEYRTLDGGKFYAFFQRSVECVKNLRMEIGQICHDLHQNSSGVYHGELPLPDYAVRI
ncbi:MAG: type III secretion system chaperone [Desulfamplus sp.]|nr:type III secretion system chaperone [Desulfamplus sp.]